MRASATMQDSQPAAGSTHYMCGLDKSEASRPLYRRLLQIRPPPLGGLRVHLGGHLEPVLLVGANEALV